MIALKSKTKNL